MAYTVKDHGTWSLYRPDVMPGWAEGMGIPIAFAKSDGDGTDWYEYRKAAFGDGSIVATVLKDPANDIETVKAVFRDVSMLFPANHRVIEIIGFDPADPKPHNEFAWMTYDPATKTLGDPAPQPVISVYDYQFAGQAAAEGIISDEAADKWVTTGVIPDQLVQAVKAQNLGADRERRVFLFLKGTNVFPRFHELTPLLAALFGKDTSEKVDAFFQAASLR